MIPNRSSSHSTITHETHGQLTTLLHSNNGTLSQSTTFHTFFSILEGASEVVRSDDEICICAARAKSGLKWACPNFRRHARAKWLNASIASNQKQHLCLAGAHMYICSRLLTFSLQPSRYPQHPLRYLQAVDLVPAYIKHPLHLPLIPFLSHQTEPA